VSQGAAMFLLFVAVIAGTILLGIEREKSARERCRRFAAAITVEDRVLKLPGETKLGRGRFVLRGEWRGTRKRHYAIERTFTATDEIISDGIELAPERFSVEVKENDDALVELPAYLIEDGKFRGTVVVPIIPSYSVEVERGPLEASRDMEFAHLRLDTLENGFYGKLYVNVNRCRGARVELEKSGLRTKEKLAELKGSGEAELRREFWIEPIILIMDRKYSDPRKLRDVFGRRLILEGHGDYVLRLILDVPFSKDVHDAAMVTVRPGEDVPKEREEPEVRVVV